MGVANRSQKYKTPVIVVTGAIGENIQEAYNKGITAIFSINKEPMEFSKSALKSKENMILTMENILRLLKIWGGKYAKCFNGKKWASRDNYIKPS